MQQMHNKVVFQPVKGKLLINNQKRGALRVLMFLKKKISGKTKGRAVADSQKKRKMDKINWQSLLYPGPPLGTPLGS